MTRPGELYLAFGWLGIALGAAALGAVTGVWYRWLMFTKPFGLASPAIYFTFVMTAGLVTQKNYLFSSLVLAFANVAAILLLALAAYGYSLVLRRPRRKAASVSGAHRRIPI